MTQVSRVTAVEIDGRKKQSGLQSKVQTFYDPPLSKLSYKTKRADYQDKTKIRRWRVRISEIEILNTARKTFSPFVQFIVGGTYCITYKKTGSKTVKEEVGEMGQPFSTDVVTDLMNQETGSYSTLIDTELRASYYQIEQE